MASIKMAQASSQDDNHSVEVITYFAKISDRQAQELKDKTHKISSLESQLHTERDKAYSLQNQLNDTTKRINRVSTINDAFGIQTQGANYAALNNVVFDALSLGASEQEKQILNIVENTVAGALTGAAGGPAGIAVGAIVGLATGVVQDKVATGQKTYAFLDGLRANEQKQQDALTAQGLDLASIAAGEKAIADKFDSLDANVQEFLEENQLTKDNIELLVNALDESDLEALMTQGINLEELLSKDDFDQAIADLGVSGNQIMSIIAKNALNDTTTTYGALNQLSQFEQNRTKSRGDGHLQALQDSKILEKELAFYEKNQETLESLEYQRGHDEGMMEAEKRRINLEEQEKALAELQTRKEQGLSGPMDYMLWENANITTERRYLNEIVYGDQAVYGDTNQEILMARETMVHKLYNAIEEDKSYLLAARDSSESLRDSYSAHLDNMTALLKTYESLTQISDKKLALYEDKLAVYNNKRTDETFNQLKELEQEKDNALEDKNKVETELKSLTKGLKNAGAEIAPAAAFGLPYVPRDNYLALLHEGEQVLTAQEARQRRTGGAPVNVTGNHFTIREEADIYKIAQALAAEIRKAQMVS